MERRWQLQRLLDNLVNILPRQAQHLIRRPALNRRIIIREPLAHGRRPRQLPHASHALAPRQSLLSHLDLLVRRDVADIPLVVVDGFLVRGQDVVLGDLEGRDEEVLVGCFLGVLECACGGQSGCFARRGGERLRALV